MGLGIYLAMIGAGLAAGLAGCGSAIGVGTAAKATTGVVAEDPSKFGKCFLIMLLPATQGIYGLVIAIFALLQTGIMGGDGLFNTLTVEQGATVFAACLPMAIAGLVSAIHQGKAAASSIAMVAKRPDQSGKGLIVTVMIETYALLALLVSFLGIFMTTSQWPTAA